ncbi:TetR/AcrR family transcriptional regulator [Nitrospira moscoviensis]|uniref:Putative tetR-family transcriptional regulator n=1 Tax=Nitrospira moscoviensis TaxID=42253 RepID=A0A0K2G7C7_NITMO|nr:TetR/AcrR family transcriptional regulator [Nitrospira moscoviensis]ALA56881.1 putative tetR-family transcriptional regulator [Nitrospira moscoviensis]
MPRPKEFNPDEALDKAMQVFWHKGYEATSMEDLLEAMDLNRGSLYDTFGDKRQLFLKVMDRYCTCFVGPKFSLLDQPGPALPLLRRFVHGMIDGALADPQRRGCLIANTVMELAPHEKNIAGKVNQALKMGEDAFFGLLTRAQQQGELRPDKDPRALARFLTTMLQGTIVMIKAGAPPEQITQTAETALAVLN